MPMGERWVGIRKIHKFFHVRGVVDERRRCSKKSTRRCSKGRNIRRAKRTNKEGNKQRKKLKKLYKDLPEKQKKLAEKIIENAAFIAVQLKLMQEDIKENGIKEFYMNGKGQFGYKESVASKTYNVSIKNYMNIIKQLNDMLPEEKQISEDDEFDRFNGLA